MKDGVTTQYLCGKKPFPYFTSHPEITQNVTQT